jgi:periplasmic protein TonB
MNKFFLVLICLCFFNVSNAQDNKHTEDNNVYSSFSLEHQPEFPGGWKAFSEFIKVNYRLPDIKGLKGKVIVEFVVEKDGRIVETKIMKDVGYGTGVELMRVLSESPLWKPGMQSGKLVRCRFSLPINVDVK